MAILGYFEVTKTRFEHSEYVVERGKWLKREFYTEELKSEVGHEYIRAKVIVSSVGE